MGQRHRSSLSNEASVPKREREKPPLVRRENAKHERSQPQPADEVRGLPVRKTANTNTSLAPLIGVDPETLATLPRAKSRASTRPLAQAFPSLAAVRWN